MGIYIQPRGWVSSLVGRSISLFLAHLKYTHIYVHGWNGLHTYVGTKTHLQLRAAEPPRGALERGKGRGGRLVLRHLVVAAGVGGCARATAWDGASCGGYCDGGGAEEEEEEGQDKDPRHQP